MRLARTIASRVSAICGLLLVLATVIAWLTGGFAFSLGPLRVSATDPGRLLMEGSIALLGWALVTLEAGTPRRTALVFCILVAYYVALVAESSPRRVGDGHEYVAMARQLSVVAPPSLSPADIEAIDREMSELPGYGASGLRESGLVAPDGRKEFVHFWLYPLLVAPVLAVVRAAGGHWNHAFTIVNLALLGVFAWCATARLRLDAAILLACSPVIWWIDKAHVEVFNYALVGTALVLLRATPGTSLVLLGLVTAQNPAFAVILCPLAAAVIWKSKGADRRRLAVAAAVAVLIVCVHPAYYLWRLGHPAPLAGAVGRVLPGPTAFLTPLIDPDLGLCWWFPALLVTLAITLTARGARDHDAAVLWAISAGAFALLAIFAMSGNINHGATPGLSRYGIWIAPLTVVALGPASLTGWRTIALSAVALTSVAQASWVSHPKLSENSLAPTSASIWISDHTPWLYDPLPEVFSERYSGVDGTASLPAASHECGKVLLQGLGTATVRWPIPCAPAPVPKDCSSAGVLCYANRSPDGYNFRRAPRQPGFGFAPGTRSDLLWSGPGDFSWVPVDIDWPRLSSVLPLGGRSPIRDSALVSRVVAFQNEQDFVAFIVTTERQWLGQPRVRLAAAGSGDELWWFDLDRKVTAAHQRLVGDGWLDMPSPRARLLVVRRGAIAR